MAESTSTSDYTIPKICPAIFLTGSSNVNRLVVQERTVPDLPTDKIMVEIKACGLNFKEMMERMGIPGTASNKSKPPYVMGFEGSGIIVQIGSEVKSEHIKIGNRVCVVGSEVWSKYTILDPKFCFPIPDNMTFEEAAAFPVVYLTAYMMLFQQANLQPGMSVLIHMVAGGVGTAAVQLCRSVSDVTIFGTCSAAKHERMKEMGVDHLIDYRTQDYAQEIKRISPRGVDIILEPLGGPDFKKSYDLLDQLGHIISFGFANAVTGDKMSYFTMAKNWLQWKNVNSMAMMQENRTVSGYHLLYVSLSRMDKVMCALKQLNLLYKDGKIKPLIDSVHGFSQIGTAVARMNSRQNIGKIVIVPEETTTGGNDEGTSDVSKWKNPEEDTPTKSRI
ncbi:Synaptic vesicle membrane protein VAT-1-like [Oopsacas minuta]|uniref:Synaptic vesicle membrane protein VAT-1-like n=1 Tax=Oopsacas minuta TaxID=111878 RepID=A0AAV7KBT7_9METZ|nr:Synaptic vesicle membrane protein VAT-1-like [Oopsacas minuta]